MSKLFPRQDGSYALGSSEAKAYRLNQLSLPHIAPLTDFVEDLRLRCGSEYSIPYFDPSDGGTSARVLFLLEAPGPKAVNSSFISRDNPDPSARNFRFLLNEANLTRENTVLWNTVPWYIGAEDQSKIRAAQGKDVKLGAAHLPQLLNLLPELKAIVLVGRKAQSARKIVAALTSIKIFETFHPSNQVVVCQPLLLIQMRRDLKEISEFLQN